MRVVVRQQPETVVVRPPDPEPPPPLPPPNPLPPPADEPKRVVVRARGLVGPAGEKGEEGPPGGPGPAGPAGDINAVVFTRHTAQTLSGHRVVHLDFDGTLAYASSDGIAQGPFMLTTGAADADTEVSVLAIGEITEPSWAFEPGPVFLGLNGLLTQIAPTQGYVIRVGYATSPTSMFFDPQLPIAVGGS
jgi:hypothetical protein